MSDFKNIRPTVKKQTVFQRREITELFEGKTDLDRAQRDLFLLSFAELKKIQAKDPGSYSYTASIHGFKCAHGITTFPTWHRPYIGLIEQLIQERAIAIAESYPPNQIELYRKAAQQLRFPYWDWASKKTLTTGVPTIFTAELPFKVTAPPGKSLLSNPLISANTAAGTPISRNISWVNVGGHIKSIEGAPGVEKVRSDISNVFLTKDWFDFSTHNTDRNRPRSNGIFFASSLEFVHDYIHVMVGGSMESTATSAFDPIFYFHHCNVDRFFAIWQVLHPTVYVETQNISKPLDPFLVDNKPTPWTSKGCQNVRDFGYTYSDLEGPTNTLLKRMQDAYDEPPAVAHFMRATSSFDTALNAPVSVEEGLRKQQSFALETPVAVAVEATPESHIVKYVKNEDLQDFREWYAVIIIGKHVLNGSFSISVFVGDIPDNSNDWPNAPSFAGNISIFAPEDINNCENCMERPDVQFGGNIDITHTMLKQGISLILDDNTINALKTSLKFRICDPRSREVIDPVTRFSMAVSVHTATLHVTEDERFERDNWTQVGELSIN